MSGLRIIFSTIALVAFVICSMFTNLVVEEQSQYFTRAWRVNVMNDIFVFIPFVALFVFALMERKTKFFDKRLYVTAIFGIYAVQHLMMMIFKSVSDFSIFSCSLLAYSSFITVFFILARTVMLLLSPFVNIQYCLAVYAAGSMLFFAIMLIVEIDVYSKYSAVRCAEIVMSVIVDLLFSLALFYFNDLLDNDGNEMSLCQSLKRGIDEFFSDIIDDVEYDFDDGHKKSIGFDVGGRFHSDDGTGYGGNDVGGRYGSGRESDDGNNEKRIYFSDIMNDNLLNTVDSYSIGANRFLKNPPEGTYFCFNISRKGNKVDFTGMFTYHFTPEEAEKLRELNNTQEGFLMDADIEECHSVGLCKGEKDTGDEGDSYFIISLIPREFEVSENYDGVRRCMIRFIKEVSELEDADFFAETNENND